MALRRRTRFSRRRGGYINQLGLNATIRVCAAVLFVAFASPVRRLLVHESVCALTQGLIMAEFKLESLDLAALLCSRVCHDVISPVGAIVNGLEVLEDEKDADMRGFAMDLIKKSARTASARLQFCRIAFGAAGSAGASIDTGDAEQVTRNLIVDERTKLDWRATRVLMPKNKVKLILNLCLIATAAIPRGGVVTLDVTGADEALGIRVSAKGVVRLAYGVAPLLKGEPEGGSVDAHGIQAYYTWLVAQACGLAIELTVVGDELSLSAAPARAAAQADEAAA